MGAIISTTPGDPAYGGGIVGASVGGGASSSYLTKSSMLGPNYTPEMFNYLLTLNMKRVRTNEKNATVTMEELGEFPVHPEADQKNMEN